MSQRDEAPLREFGKCLSKWSGQPPSLSSQEAGLQVQSRLEANRILHSTSARFAFAAVLIVLVSAGYWLRQTPSSPKPAESPQTLAPMLHDEQLLLWLDEETPLYLTLGNFGD